MWVLFPGPWLPVAGPLCFIEQAPCWLPADTLLRPEYSLLFLVPTLGRKQFGEGNCKLALWLSLLPRAGVTGPFLPAGARP